MVGKQQAGSNPWWIINRRLLMQPIVSTVRFLGVKTDLLVLVVRGPRSSRGWWEVNTKPSGHLRGWHVPERT